jgi:mannosyltransferase OCH1-like enzyme
MIPKILHFVWVGDESKRPDNCINTWKKLNPTYKVYVWGNKDYEKNKWANAQHMAEMYMHELNGVADMMRYEIIHAHGGIALDADSVCVRPLEDWLLEPSEFSCWESETLRPNLIAAGCIASVPKSPFFEQVIQDIKQKPTVIDTRAWLTTGPQALTDTWNKTKYPLTIYPSHYFIPNHFCGTPYAGTGQVFAEQYWASTHGTYDSLHQKEV